VINLNDEPSVNLDGLSDVVMKSDEIRTIDFKPLLSDIDDPVEEIWLTASSAIPGSVQYDYISGILSMQWEEPGTHTVSINLIDRHGDSSDSDFVVTVLDTRPLTWKTDDSSGDILVSVDGPYVGHNASVSVSNVGELQLSEISITWTICNSIVGICHTAGSHNGMGSFEAAPVSGNGMALGDYLTIFVRALDGDNWERETDGNLKINSIEATDGPEEITEIQEDPEEQQSDGSENPESSTTDVVMYAFVILLFICGGVFAGLRLSNPRVAESIARRTDSSLGPSDSRDDSIDFESAPPEEETLEQSENYPPLPEGGLPEGWTMDQWKYYGEDYLNRQ